MKEKKNRFKLSTLDVYVIFSIVCLLIYTIVSQILNARYGTDLSVLTTCFFACFGGEILSACLIKIFKLKKKEDEEKKNEEEVG